MTTTARTHRASVPPQHSPVDDCTTRRAVRGRQPRPGRPVGRQRSQPLRDDRPRPACARRFHPHHARSAAPTWRPASCPAGVLAQVRDGAHARRGAARAAVRRRRAAAARLGAVGSALLDARDDGDGARRRAQRRDGRRPRRAFGRAVRLGLLRAAHRHVRAHGARRGRRAAGPRHRRGAPPPRRDATRASSTPTDCASWWPPRGASWSPTSAATSRRTRTSSWSPRSSPCCGRGTRRAPGSTGAARASPTPSAPP